MDRAAKLAAEATFYLRLEEGENAECVKTSREETRAGLAELAQHLGFSPNEISAAVDQALTDAGTTP